MFYIILKLLAFLLVGGDTVSDAHVQSLWGGGVVFENPAADGTGNGCAGKVFIGNQCAFVGANGFATFDKLINAAGLEQFSHVVDIWHVLVLMGC